METQTFEEELELKWRLGARTAALLTRLAGGFESEILLSSGGGTASAKSIMGVLIIMHTEEDGRRMSEVAARAGAESEEFKDARRAHGPRAGLRFTLSVRGPDAAEAFRALKDFFSLGSRLERCPEQGCHSLPCLVGADEFRIYYSCKNYHNWSVKR